MTLNEIFNLFKKRGVCDTYQVLTKFKNYKAEMQAFYKELNKFSYYNSFFRVKVKLVEKGIISIKKRYEKIYIRLTKKGINIYNKLEEINELIRKK